MHFDAFLLKGAKYKAVPMQVDSFHTFAQFCKVWFSKPESPQITTSGGQVLNLSISAGWRQNYTIYSVLVIRIFI